MTIHSLFNNFIVAILLGLYVGTRGNEVQYSERGKDLNLKCGIPGNAEMITWKFGEDKVVEWDPINKEFWFKSQGFTGKLDSNTGDVKIFNSNRDGMFTCEKQGTGGTLKKKSYTVELLDQPLKPTVNCKSNETHFTLQCSVNTTNKEKAFWSGPDEIKAEGPELIINKMLDKSSLFYCTAKNSINSADGELTLQNCEDVEKNGTSATGIIVGTIVLVLVLVIAAAFLLYWKWEDWGLSKYLCDSDNGRSAGGHNDADAENNCDSPEAMVPLNNDINKTSS